MSVDRLHCDTGERTALMLHHGAVELAGIGEAGDDGLVEPLDDVVGAGQQHR